MATFKVNVDSGLPSELCAMLNASPLPVDQIKKLLPPQTWKQKLWTGPPPVSVETYQHMQTRINTIESIDPKWKTSLLSTIKTIASQLSTSGTQPPSDHLPAGASQNTWQAWFARGMMHIRRFCHLVNTEEQVQDTVALLAILCNNLAADIYIPGYISINDADKTDSEKVLAHLTTILRALHTNTPPATTLAALQEARLLLTEWNRLSPFNQYSTVLSLFPSGSVDKIPAPPSTTPTNELETSTSPHKDSTPPMIITVPSWEQLLSEEEQTSDSQIIKNQILRIASEIRSVPAFSGRLKLPTVPTKADADKNAKLKTQKQLDADLQSQKNMLLLLKALHQLIANGIPIPTEINLNLNKDIDSVLATVQDLYMRNYETMNMREADMQRFVTKLSDQDVSQHIDQFLKSHLSKNSDTTAKQDNTAMLQMIEARVQFLVPDFRFQNDKSINKDSLCQQLEVCYRVLTLAEAGVKNFTGIDMNFNKNQANNPQNLQDAIKLLKKKEESIPSQQESGDEQLS